MNEGPTPPTVSEWDESDSLAAERPGWAKVVGIISIVWGSLAILCGACGIAWIGFITPAMLPPDQKVPPTLFMSPAQMVLGGISFLFSAVLIVAGAMTVGRKPAGRILHLVYAVAAIVIWAVGIPLAIQQQAVLAQWVRDNPDHPIAKSMQGASGNVGQAIGYVMGAIFGLVYPLFLVVWFALVKRKPDSMTGGGTMDEPAA